MTRRRIYDEHGYPHFITFSCYKNRRLLDHDKAKNIVMGCLRSQLLKQDGTCLGFVVMPDHVHAMVWFPEDHQLSHFMKQWKQRSSVQIKKFLRESLPAFFARFSASDPTWQPRYYSFNVFSEAKIKEKLLYMHRNPVRAGLVRTDADWPYSSAGWYLLGKSVGVPIGQR